jgi:hypothetical protein
MEHWAGREFGRWLGMCEVAGTLTHPVCSRRTLARRTGMKTQIQQRADDVFGTTATQN